MKSIQLCGEGTVTLWDNEDGSISVSLQVDVNDKEPLEPEFFALPDGSDYKLNNVELYVNSKGKRLLDVSLRADAKHKRLKSSV